jgi:hypothetical protein
VQFAVLLGELRSAFPGDVDLGEQLRGRTGVEGNDDPRIGRRWVDLS